MLQHPYKVLVSIIFFLALCWVSAFVIMSTKTCWNCGAIHFVPELRTSFDHFYCEKCFVEVS